MPKTSSFASRMSWRNRSGERPRITVSRSAALGSSVDGSDDAPTAQSYDVFNDLAAKIDAQLTLLAKTKSEDIAEFNKQYAAKGLPVIIPGK